MSCAGRMRSRFDSQRCRRRLIALIGCRTNLGRSGSDRSGNGGQVVSDVAARPANQPKPLGAASRYGCRRGLRPWDFSLTSQSDVNAAPSDETSRPARRVSPGHQLQGRASSPCGCALEAIVRRVCSSLALSSAASVTTTPGRDRSPRCPHRRRNTRWWAASDGRCPVANACG
jgi:hypothetical protein